MSRLLGSRKSRSSRPRACALILDCPEGVFTDGVFEGFPFWGGIFLRVRCVFLFLLLCGHSSLLCIGGSGLSIAALRWVVTAHQMFCSVCSENPGFLEGMFSGRGRCKCL